MNRSESDIQAEILLYLDSRPGSRMFRNNTGVRGRVRFGLCKGSSDLIGYTEVKITPAMVGKKVAVFTAIEVKKPKGRPTPEQAEFIACTESSGGLAMVASSVDTVIQRVKGYLTKLRRKTQ